MHAISSYYANRPTNKPTNTDTQDRLQYTAPQLSMQCNVQTKLTEPVKCSYRERGKRVWTWAGRALAVSSSCWWCSSLCTGHGARCRTSTAPRWSTAGGPSGSHLQTRVTQLDSTVSSIICDCWLILGKVSICNWSVAWINWVSQLTLLLPHYRFRNLRPAIWYILKEFLPCVMSFLWVVCYYCICTLMRAVIWHTCTFSGYINRLRRHTVESYCVSWMYCPIIC